MPELTGQRRAITEEIDAMCRFMRRDIVQPRPQVRFSQDVNGLVRHLWLGSNGYKVTGDCLSSGGRRRIISSSNSDGHDPENPETEAESLMGRSGATCRLSLPQKLRLDKGSIAERMRTTAVRIGDPGIDADSLVPWECGRWTGGVFGLPRSFPTSVPSSISRRLLFAHTFIKPATYRQRFAYKYRVTAPCSFAEPSNTHFRRYPSQVSITWSAFVALVGYFPNLRDLDIFRTSFQVDNLPVPPPPHALRGRLSITSWDVIEFPIDRLVALKLEYEEFEMYGVCETRLVTAVERSLKRLTIDQIYPESTLSLSRCPELRQLEVTTAYPQEQEWTLISSITSSANLRKLIFPQSISPLRQGILENPWTRGRYLWIFKLFAHGSNHVFFERIRTSGIAESIMTETKSAEYRQPTEEVETIDTFLLPEKVSPPSPAKKPQELDSGIDEEVLALDSDEKSDWSEIESWILDALNSGVP
ncbi:hypothetical protein BDM02DRAFT_3264250 [Thelephora ganbajun]|uniref:Uncharacterized protein n=1 Tax=Thelephora ganbajun TaxID=370292 RepID=A0ACB6Z0P5_THEGA|nr:hypothetical protein BDM02DRAFT_3264250 [Thelephora ganbajun]